MLSPDEISELTTAETLLSRKIIRCDIAHEDVDRDEKGLPILYGSFRAECSVQHFACPHFLDQYVDRINSALEILTNKCDVDCTEIILNFQVLANRQIRVDNRVRAARTGIDGKNLNPHPSAEEGKTRAEPHIRTFNENCDRLDVLRLQALTKVRAALAGILQTT